MLALSNQLEKALVISIGTGLALVLLTPLVVMAPPFPATFFPFIVGKAVIARTLIEITLGLWVVLAIRHPSYRTQRSWLLTIFLVYVLVALLASLTGVSPQRSLWSTYERMQGWVDLAHWFAFTVVLASVFRSWTAWRVLLNINLGISFAMGLLGLAQHFNIRVFEFLATEQRLDITLGNPTYVGGYMMVNVLIALGFLTQSFLRRGQPDRSRALERRRRQVRSEGISSETWWRLFWITAMLLDALILYLSATRGALLGLSAGLVAFGLGYAIWGQVVTLRRVSLVMVGCIVVFAVVLILARNTPVFKNAVGANVMLSRIAATGFGDSSLRGRLNSALVGFNGFTARPVLGWGPENFTVAYDRHLTADIATQSVTSFDQAHNKLIEELTTKGMLGFLGYMAMWLYMLSIIIRRVRKQSARAQILTLFGGAALAGYFIQNLFLFDTPGTVVQFYLLMGFMVFLDTSPSDTAAVATAATRKAERARSVTGAGRVRLLKSDASVTVAFVATGLVVLLAIYFVSYRPYHGATAVLGTIERSISWEERLDRFERTVNAFEPLANYPRIIMFNQISNNWGTMSQEEAIAALEAVDREGRDALKAEPEEWRIYVALVSVYHRAASLDPVYAARARSLVDAAVRLAPERVETQQALVRQFMVEKDYEGARETIDRYVEKSPRAEVHFADLRNSIDSAAGR